MDTSYLTIKEAADRYAKAEITIRRFVRNIVKASQSADRALIRPSQTEVEKLQKKNKPFSYAISVDLLERAYHSAPAGTAAPQSPSAAAEKPYVALLAEQLRVKDEQIRALNQALETLSERQRE